MRFHNQTQTLYTRSVVMLRTSDRLITEQRSQEADILAPDKIRTRNSSRRAAVDRRFRPHGHLDWPNIYALVLSSTLTTFHVPWNVTAQLLSSPDITIWDRLSFAFIRSFGVECGTQAFSFNMLRQLLLDQCGITLRNTNSWSKPELYPFTFRCANLSILDSPFSIIHLSCW